MFVRGNNYGKILALALVLLLCVSSLSVCLADAYTEYHNGYVALMANGIVDADLKASMTMDGQTVEYSGNMKVDSNRNLMIYEMSSGDGTSLVFTDGSTFYTQMGDSKIKYPLIELSEDSSAEPEEPAEGSEGELDTPEKIDGFDIKSFLENFTSLLDPAKIAELGLLSPISEMVVSETDKSGNVYTLDIADGLAQIFLNAIADELGDGNENGDNISFTDLSGFTYQATVENGVVTGSTYAGNLTVHVPASILGTGSDADYQLGFNIQITFNNPGNEAAFELPSTEGFEEVDASTQPLEE